MNRLAGWWDGLSDPERRQWTAVAAAVALFCVHFVVYSPWLIEDAAITYSYARSGATGEGWVAYPGGEWVEGFSNPTWTAILTTLRFFGLSPWLAGKWLGLFFGVITLPLAFLWAREVTGDDGLLPCVAPLWLAVTPQYAMWASSGLENPLWCWLLTAGALAFLRELKHGGPMWSALPMALLAITRPEGPLYVAVMAFTGVGLSWRRPRVWARLAAWSVLCGAVWAAYIAYRYQVFGWPLPNTYYAKLHIGVDRFQPFVWFSKGDYIGGWPYLRAWAAWSVFGFLIPLFPVSATGWKGWRGQVGMGLGAVLALLLIPGAEWLVTSPVWPMDPEPSIVTKARVILLGFTLVTVPWLGLGRRGHQARILAWTLAAAMFGFAIYVGLDWMLGYRWINFAVVPLSVMFADLLVALSRARPWANPRRAQLVIFAVFGGIPLTAAVVHTGTLQNPTEVSPWDVGRRVAYMNRVQERLHLDHALLFDVDMGATQWWSGDRILDVAGLIDTPMAQHAWEPAFVREYVLRERRPDFIHNHGHWARTSKLGSQPMFARDYLQIDDFVSGPANMHTGNYVRRDLFLRKRWEGPARRVDFGRLRLEGLDLPAGTVFAGGTLYVELGWRALEDQLPPFRAIVVLSQGERVVSMELPPAYDWVMPPKWRRNEVVHGFHTLTLPADLEEGPWDVALVVIGADGVWPATPRAADPVYARGEARWDGLLEVASVETVLARVDTALDEMREHADAGRCVQAEASFEQARRSLPPDHRVQPWADPQNHGFIGRCWARRAQDEAPQAAEGAISQARLWSHHDPEVVAIGEELADRWEIEGDAAWEEGKYGAAYGAWKRTLAADPGRSHVRVRAERARDLRLGLVEPVE